MKNAGRTSLLEMLFFGSSEPDPIRAPLKGILEHYAVIRRAIARAELVEPLNLESFIAKSSYLYALNSYKAIGVLLTESFYESSTAVLRQIWGVSLNLHWLEIDPARRAHEFCNFTVMEHGKLGAPMDDFQSLITVDQVKESSPSESRNHDSKDKGKTCSCFATQHMEDLAIELGNPWLKELDLVYHLTAMHAYGSPGSLLDAMTRQHTNLFEVPEQKSAALIAILAIKFIMRDVLLVTRMGILRDNIHILAAHDDFRRFIRDR